MLQLCTFRFSDEEDQRDLARSLKPLDTEQRGMFHKNLAYHSLSSLMHLALEDLAGKDLLPDGAGMLREECATAFHRDLVRTTLIDHNCRLLLLDSAQSGLLPMPLKGNYLSSLVYSRQDARPYRDVDLLVRPQDLPAMAEVLKRNGYLPRRGMEEFLPAPYSTTYVKRLEGDRLKVDLDLHTSIHWPREYFARTRFDATDIWRQASRIDFNGMPAMAMSPEHLVIYTCLDLAINHRFAHLLKFRDLYEILSRFTLDYDELLRWVDRWKVRSYVCPALDLFRQAGGDSLIPPNLLADLDPCYLLSKVFGALLPARALPSHRARNASPANLVFFLLADDPRQRYSGLLHLPRHLLRKFKHPDLH